MPNDTLLAKTFVQLADTLVAEFDMVDSLSMLTDRCVEILDVDQAGLMLVSPEGNLHVMSSSSEEMRLLELFELQSEEGPCLDCFHSGEPVVNDDLATVGGRWPRFSSQALAVGFHAAHALPMRLRGSIIGALNLFQRDQGVLSQVDLAVGQALADIATIAILQHRAARETQILTDQLQSALNSRVVIEQAKGMLAQANRLDLQEAFAMLRRYSRSHNLGISLVATSVVNGKLPPSGFAELPGAGAPRSSPS
jgi:GAF domain-containing protein